MELIVNTDPTAYEGKWHEFRPGVEALIVPYTRRIIRKVIAQATVARPDAGGQPAATAEQAYAGSRVDPELWDKYLYREIIRDMTGLVGPDGAPVACGPEAIDAVCDQVGGFAAWALERARTDAAALTARQEQKIKN
jgi:hypothetical protein